MGSDIVEGSVTDKKNRYVRKFAIKVDHAFVP